MVMTVAVMYQTLLRFGGRAVRTILAYVVPTASGFGPARAEGTAL